MPIAVQEKFESRQSTSGESSQVELAYIISGTDDDLAAKNALAAAAPTLYDALVRQTLQIEPIGPGIWDGVARYGSPQTNSPTTGSSTFAFDTSGGTQHITQSIQTPGSYSASGPAPNFRGAIGVTDASGGVEGVDITVPIYSFSETHVLPDAVVTAAYKGTLFQLTGKVNSAAFRGLAAGECLFLGASGSKRTVGDGGTSEEGGWEISFRFAGSPNRSNLTIGSISGIAKKGWEYLWVRYADGEDEASQTIVKQPVAVYVEQVYETADFASLGIGS